MAAEIEPSPVVKARAFHDQRVPLPMPHGVAAPSRVRILREVPAIHQHLPEIAAIEKGNRTGSLQDLVRTQADFGSDSRQATELWVVDTKLFRALTIQCLCPGLHIAWFEIRSDIEIVGAGIGLTDSREIRLAVGRLE